MHISHCMCGDSIYLLLVNILPFPTCATAGSQWSKTIVKDLAEKMRASVVTYNRQRYRKENEGFNGLITWWSTWSHRDTHFLIIGARRNMHGKPHTLGTLVRKGYQSCTSGSWICDMRYNARACPNMGPRPTSLVQLRKLEHRPHNSNGRPRFHATAPNGNGC